MDQRTDHGKKIKDLLRLYRNGLTITDIAGKLHLNRNSTAKYLEILLISGDVALSPVGPAKVYTISHKVPISAMLRFSADFILLIDQERRILDLNDNALTLLRMSREDLVGVKIDELNSPLILRLALPDSFRQIQETGEVQREFAITRDDTDHHFRVRLIPTVFDNQEEGVTVIGEDITDQIRFEERLMVSEARFRAIVEDQTDFICRWTPDGTITFINDSLSRFVGISCIDVNGKSLFSFIHPEDTGNARSRVSLITNDSPTQSVELRILGKNDEYHWHHWNTRGIFDAAGTLIECQSVGRDITQLKQSQEALSQSEVLYRTILDNIPDAYYRSDNKGNLTMASPSMARMLEYSTTQELIGRNIAESFYYHPEKRLSFLTDLYRQKNIVDREIILKKGDGSPLVVSTNSQLLYDSLGNVIGVEGILRDISHRKRAERELRESEERYRNVVEDQTELICRFTRDGTITFVNDAYCRYFGLPKTASIGMHHQVNLTKTDADLMKRHLASLTPERPSDSIEHRIIMPDGQVRWQAWTDRAVFDEGGRLIEYQSVGRDTTEMQEQAKKLRESEERFRMITERSPFPIAIMDKDDTFRYLNRKFEEVFGYTLHDIPTGKDWIARAFPDPAVQARAAVSWNEDRRHTEQKTNESGVFPVTCRDGTVRQITHYPIALDNGDLCVLFEDLTSKAESDRLRSVITSIVNSSNEAIIGKTLDGTILSWNRTAERYYGYLAEEAVGKSIDIIIPEELRGQLSLMLMRVGNGETIDRFTTTRLRKDGSRIEVCVTLSPIRDEEERIVGISTIARSITERTKSEAGRVFRQQVLHRR